ncbi:MAG: hypothetical protein ABF567_07485 [Acetobacter okinawensis]
MSNHPLAFMRLPTDLLMALDSRTFHFWFQPIHYLVRMLHILSMAGFFGLEMLFALAVVQQMDKDALVRLSRFMLRPLHISYSMAMITGFALFFYDPVHIGARAYITPKLLALVLSGVLEWYGHKAIYWPIMKGREDNVSVWCKVFCFSACMVWVAVIVFSCLNTEGVPKVFLRHYF